MWNLRIVIQKYAQFWFFRKWSGNSFSTTFCVWFSKKLFLMLILLTDQTSLFDCLYFLRYWAICVLQLFVSDVCDVKNSEINLIFLIKPFFYVIKKSRQKLKYLENEKSLRWNKKHFSSFLKGFQLGKIVSYLTLCF